ncbi:oligosaccharide flippase family protein [Pseudoalteromonas sp.]|jgi:O-antigen/teichoic acid export membrane protein|uniref:lipopolysaccharide biosynthesis protein n=1 Tax=Pseudoalteromonas sp. TaxID=53249 RepID=UPI0023542FAE|nr:oligosaccharide flippase family protein [Pseudoalteromonas sp.]
MNGMKQIAYFGLSTLFLKVLGFALLPISTRILSQAEFGELNFLVSISAVMSLLLCLGLPELLFKQHISDPQRKRALFRDALILCGFLSCVFVFILFYFIEPFSALLPVPLNTIDIKLLAVNLALSSVLSVLFCYFRYYEMAKQFCVLAILQGAGQTLCTLILLYLGYGVTGVMVSGVISSTLVLLIALSLVINQLGISFKYIAWNITPKNCLFLLSIIVSSLFVYANNGAENWFIAASVGKEKLAQYYVVLQFALMTSFTFEPIRMWWFSRRFNELTQNRTKYIFLCKLSLDIGILLCALMIIVTPHIFSIVLPHNYQLNTWLLPSLIVVVVLRHHSDLLNIGCYTQFNGLFVTVINAISALIALLLLGFLVPKFGVSGAVSALACAQLVKTGLFVAISQKLEYLAFKVKSFVPSWVCFLLIYILSIIDLAQYVLWQLVTFVGFLIVLFYKYKPLISNAIKPFLRIRAHD